MNFEDLFVKQRPPKDYVSYPPQETPTLEKFFQERTAAPAASVSPTTPAPSVPTIPKIAEPISEEKKQVIKSNFNLNPQPVVPQESAMPQPEMAQPEIAQQEITPQQPIMQFPDLAETSYEETRKPATELDSIPDQAEKMLPKRDWTDMLPYLVPLAVGALSGDTFGASSGIAGEQLLKGEGERVKRKQSLEDQLMAMQKAKISKKTTSPKYQLKPLRNKATGESFIGSYDPTSNTMTLQDGTPVDTAQYELAPGLSTPEFQKRQGIMEQNKKELGNYFGKGRFVNPETGLLSTVKNGKVVPLQVSENQLDPKQQKDLTNIVKDFKASDAYKKSLAALQDAVAADSLLLAANSGNPIAANAARTKLARMSGEVGALSDTDLAAYGGSPAYRSQAKRFANLQKTTIPLTKPEIAQLQEIVNIFEKSARINMNNSVSGLEADFLQMDGVPGAVQTKIAPFIPSRGAKKSTPAGMVLMISPKGVKGFVPQANVQKALDNEYTKAP